MPSKSRGVMEPESEHFLSHLLDGLDCEARAEAERIREQSRRLSSGQAERTGRALVDLAVDDETVGLGGRTVATFVKRNRTLGLPWHRLRAGTPVVVTAHDEKHTECYRGVVVRTEDRRLLVALATVPDDWTDSPAWRIDASPDEIALDRQRQAVRKAQRAERDRFGKLCDVLLGKAPPRVQVMRSEPAWSEWLNESQRAAVRQALEALDVALVHGPPGTGKTATLGELMRLAVARGERVLACAPSNLAVDNLLERCSAAGLRVVRLGHPARVAESLQQFTLDALVDDHPDVKLARKLMKEAWGLFRRAGRYTRAKPAPGERAAQRAEAKQMLADARRLEQKAVDHLLDSAHVLCATTTGLDAELLGDRRFDLVVIDEACQSTEPGCWPPILRAERLVLAGDHCQLPPTIVSAEARAHGLDRSLFERLVDRYGATITRTLTMQYRMHSDIMQFPSSEFYDDQLTAAASVAGHGLHDLPTIDSAQVDNRPLEFFDTAGASFDEEIEPDGDSRFNPQEAEFAARKVRQLLEAGLAPADVAVIAPYAAQVRRLRELLPVEGLEIDTVDGFQGREKEAIVVSLVRSNARGEIGFLSEIRRTNVAFTRARRKLIVIGDSATLASHPFYERWLEYVELLEGHRSVWDEWG